MPTTRSSSSAPRSSPTASPRAAAVELEGDWVVAVVVDKAAQEDFASFADAGATAPACWRSSRAEWCSTRGASEQLVDKGRTAIRGDFTQDDAEELASELTATIEE